MSRTKRPCPRPDGRHPLLAGVAWLRSTEAGIIGQGARFAVAGATVMVVSLSVTIILATVVGIAFELAFAIGFGTGLVTHFTLQRLFVWTHHEGFALPIHHQLARYLPIALSNYGLTAASIAVLPRALGLPQLVVYLGATALFTVTSFILFRTRVFHAESR